MYKEHFLKSASVSLLATLAFAGCEADPEVVNGLVEPGLSEEMVTANCYAACDCGGGIWVDCLGTCQATDYSHVECNGVPVAYCPVCCPAFSVYIPNVFTPNGDGYNDVWRVTDANNGTGSIYATAYSLNIYNRWGQSVHSKSGPFRWYYYGGDIFWNGKINNMGGLVSPSAYYYELTLKSCDGTPTSYKGWIQVIY